MTAHWTDVLELRPEVVARRGHAQGLQMSLYEAVYQTTDVPYRDASYWCEITEPTTKLVEFMAEITRHLAGAGLAGELLGGDSLFHLDQGMGGGKSHALVGLWHLARHPGAFFPSDIGQQVKTVAERRAGMALDPQPVRTVVLSADHFTPGVPRPEFGPATNLHQRFLWALFDGDRTLYDAHVTAGTDKAAIKDALEAVGGPVLILLDEVMDYAMALAGSSRDTIPDEQAFLNALTGSVNDVSGVVMVVVMIRTDLDEAGYEGPAQDLRDYLSSRLERNGTTVSVNEPQDFGAIIRRRVFARAPHDLPIAELAQEWADSASAAWLEHVFDRLPAARQLVGFERRLERSYPFHPDLLDLVEHDWTQHAGFQRVRSTVEVFAATAYWWATEHAEGRWAPPLIGVGDIPLHTAADEVLASGVLHSNERQIVGMRQVAEKDITSTDRSDGQAIHVDARVTEGRAWASAQPQPAVRLATALWMYSVAVRAQGKRGATKAELLASIYIPDQVFTFADAEEVFNALTEDEEERGLGALDVVKGGGGSQPDRYVLVTQLNKRMFQRNALNRTTSEDSYALVWERVRSIASQGSGFNKALLIERPYDEAKPLKDVFSEVDQRRSNRLVVLDPRRWTLLNGRDSATREDIESLLGLRPDTMTADWAASCVVACVNTQRRDTMVKRARQAFAWRLALAEVDRESELHAEMLSESTTALAQLDTEVRRSYQHLVYVVRDGNGLRAEFVKIEDDSKTTLAGNDVWEELAGRGDAVRSAEGLAGQYLHQLLDLADRQYTLSEVVEKFWRDPVFPMVPNENVVRRAILDALRKDDDGLQWQLVTAGGEELVVTAPEQLAIGASDQFLRLATAEDAGPAGGSSIAGGPGSTPPDGTTDGGTSDPPTETEQPPAGGGSVPVNYRVHELAISNRSLSDTAAREKLFMLLAELSDVIDPASGKDVQVATIKIELNAAEGALRAVADRAEAAGATWQEHDEDF